VTDASIRNDLAGTLVLAVLSALAAWAGRVPLLVLMIALGIVAAGEQFRLARTRGSQPLALVGLLAIAGLFAVAAWRGERAPASFAGVIAAALGLAFAVMVLRPSRTAVVRGLMATVLPVLVVGLLGAYVLAIRGIPHGVRLLYGFGAMALLADIAIEVRRAATAQSRLLYGVTGALAGGAIAAGLIGKAFTWGDAMLLALVIGAVVAGADAVASLIERALSGAQRRAMMLRRIDGVLLSAPVFFYAYRALAR
jgi:hypothetical protein